MEETQETGIKPQDSQPVQKPEKEKVKEFSIAWHLKVLAVIYVVLAVFYVLLRIFLK